MSTTVSPVFWFITGSQHLYGEETLKGVAEHTRIMTLGLNADSHIPYTIVMKPVVTTASAIEQVLREANADAQCAGVIVWMHTFSPAKMWIAGLQRLNKPLLHLHTQFNRDIPWEHIDMDFMNLNQSAHGDREFGFLATRMHVSRKVVAGYWEDPQTRHRIGLWMRSAVGWRASHDVKVVRFGDNMRDVAVTEGDKVEAQIRLGWNVTGHGVGDLVEVVESIDEHSVDSLLDEYVALYEISPEARNDSDIWQSIRTQARLELAIKRFMETGHFNAFTTTFEDLHGLSQLPGLAVQRLMSDGFGFGAEGDWKTAALVRILKVMADNRGTSFMEDYTYHWNDGQQLILGSHMLEVCPSIAAEQPRIAVYPLAIGGKDDPARL
ncbi:MAG: L-arabinose isomerase, partial [Sulfobacillus thermotolerans]|nr:L-arabinose isomerase [Sulfobacillus thermotolerans]